MATRTSRPWLCRCGYRNEGTHRKCRGCTKSRPPRRVPKHAVVLRDMSYEQAEIESQKIHGGELGACGCCGRPKPENRRHDRDHDHRTGKFRGLACFTCNRERLRGHTKQTLTSCLDYLGRADAAV